MTIFLYFMVAVFSIAGIIVICKLIVNLWCIFRLTMFERWVTKEINRKMLYEAKFKKENDYDETI